MGGGREDRDRISSEANRKMVRDNRQNLQHRKFLLDTRKNSFTVRVVKNCKRCLERFWNVHPWRYYKHSWTRSRETCSKLALFWSGSWTRWSPKIPSNLYRSVTMKLSFQNLRHLNNSTFKAVTATVRFKYKIQQKMMSRHHTVKNKWPKKSV